MEGYEAELLLKIVLVEQRAANITRFPVHYSRTMILLLVLIFTVGKVNLTFATSSDKSGYIERS